ncbi:MAG: Phosphoribosylglycinamide formyltransferase [Marinimicrobia bacterium 46_47]|nr:MAG: Phosphoribosylglycinamide formyltransferase [Marinimicrobia bacterium 46_47]KUK91044.1 MAG: phosphoribosylglycinamide formyltransferase [Marinimicrobia bacterium 46_43]
MTARLAILISGRGSNMAAILRESREGILKGLCEVAVVVSNTCSAAGLETARKAGIPAICVSSKGKKRREFEEELIENLDKYRPDYIILAGFMRILTPFFIHRYRNRILNIHPADTAQFQGIGGYEWAFEKGLKETKITVHLIDDGVDTGPVLAQKTVDLRGADTLEEVEKRGLAVERSLYSQVIRDVLTGKIH